jgi:hypothetical protein
MPHKTTEVSLNNLKRIRAINKLITNNTLKPQSRISSSCVLKYDINV